MSLEGKEGNTLNDDGSTKTQLEASDKFGGDYEKQGNAYRELQKKYSLSQSQKPDFDNMTVAEKAKLVYGEDSKYNSDIAGDLSEQSQRLSKEYGLPSSVSDKIVKDMIGNLDKSAALTRTQEREAFIKDPDNVSALKSYAIKSGKDLAQFQIDINKGKIKLDELKVYAQFGEQYSGTESAQSMAVSQVSDLPEEQAVAMYNDITMNKMQILHNPKHKEHSKVVSIYNGLCDQLGAVNVLK